MPDVQLSLINGFYRSPSLPFSAQRCLNWYPHLAQRPALNDGALFGAPGIVSVVTAGSTALSACRGARVMDGIPYFVLGQGLYRLNSDHTLDNLGVIEGVGRVSMDDNGTQLMVLVPGGKGYIYTTAPDMLVEITDSDFRANGNPQYVRFIDSLFVCTTDQNLFTVSAVNDGLSWNALDFGSAESSPDGVVVPIIYNNQLFIGGEHTAEGFRNRGGADFPFERNGVYLQQGVAAPFSAIACGKDTVFLGASKNEGPAIWLFAGNNTEKLSTDAIDAELSKLTRRNLEKVSAWYYGDSGHYFVGFKLPHTTLTYDFATGIWSERQSRVRSSGIDYEITTYRVTDVVSAYGNVYVGDDQDGRIGVLDSAVFSEYGDEIPRDAILQPFQNNMRPFFVPLIELTTEGGGGNDAITDPKIRLSISRDGGRTYGEERARSMGKRGERNHRIYWRRNGATQQTVVYRLQMSDKANPTLLQMTAQINAAA